MEYSNSPIIETGPERELNAGAFFCRFALGFRPSKCAFKGVFRPVYGILSRLFR